MIKYDLCILHDPVNKFTALSRMSYCTRFLRVFFEMPICSLLRKKIRRHKELDLNEKKSPWSRARRGREQVQLLWSRRLSFTTRRSSDLVQATLVNKQHKIDIINHLSIPDLHSTQKTELLDLFCQLKFKTVCSSLKRKTTRKKPQQIKRLSKKKMFPKIEKKKTKHFFFFFCVFVCFFFFFFQTKF